MAFFAVTRIEWSDNRPAPEGEEVDHGKKVFEPGAKVEGLPKETMKELWDAGALRQGDEPKEPPSE